MKTKIDTTKKSFLKRLVPWLLLGSGVAILILAFFGNAYARRKEAEELIHFSPQGQMVSIQLPGGELRINLYCAGLPKRGVPTVILIHGAGDNSLVWSLVQPELAKTYRVCSYDRPGYGWSEAGPAPRSASQNTDELHLLFSRAGIEPPYLLVAHSIGGLIAHQYAFRYPDEVTGLVLLDSMLADQMVAQGTFWMRLPLVDTLICRLASFTGLYRFLSENGGLAPDETVTKLPVELQPEALALSLRTGLCKTAYGEQAAAIQDVVTLHAEDGFGALPVVVLDAYETETERKGLAVRQKYVQLLSTRIASTAVGPSGHHIQLDQPEQVIQAVLLMRESIR